MLFFLCVSCLLSFKTTLSHTYVRTPCFMSTLCHSVLDILTVWSTYLRAWEDPACCQVILLRHHHQSQCCSLHVCVCVCVCVAHSVVLVGAENEWMNESMNQWINESMNEWVSEWVSEWMSERVREGRREEGGWTKELNESMNEAWMMDEGLSIISNGWITRIMDDEWMKANL